MTERVGDWAKGFSFSLRREFLVSFHFLSFCFFTSFLVKNDWLRGWTEVKVWSWWQKRKEKKSFKFLDHERLPKYNMRGAALKGLVRWAFFPCFLALLEVSCLKFNKFYIIQKQDQILATNSSRRQYTLCIAILR